MRRSATTVAGALVIVGAGVLLWWDLASDVPDVLWLDDANGGFALSPDERSAAAWTTSSNADEIVVPLHPRPSPVLKGLCDLLGMKVGRREHVYVRCDIWTFYPRPRWAAYVWTGWTQPEFDAAARSGSAITAARERAAERIGEDRFRALGGRAPASFESPR